jgi:hypothetical protein
MFSNIFFNNSSPISLSIDYYLMVVMKSVRKRDVVSLKDVESLSVVDRSSKLLPSYYPVKLVQDRGRVERDQFHTAEQYVQGVRQHG